MGIHQERNSILALGRYKKFAKIALDLAATSDRGTAHSLCALVVSKNQVLSVGYNQQKTHPISNGTPQMQLHAEMHALLRCEVDTNGADLVVVRTKPSGKPGLSRPCDICEKLIRKFGIRKVIYTENCDTPDDPELTVMRL